MADITNLNSTALPKDIPESSEDEPKIVRVAKLALILANKETPMEDRFMCLKLAIRMGFLTKEDAVLLWANRAELEDFI